jgi:para-aminobenzoate synthetase component 1
VIVLPTPPLPAAEAARRAAAAPLPFWLACAGDDDLAVEREVVGCDPVRMVRGSVEELQELEEAWRQERAGWGVETAAVPIAVGYLGYDLGRRFERLRGTRPAPSAWPDLEFRFHDAIWVRHGGRTEIWARSDAAAARLEARLLAPLAAGNGEEAGNDRLMTAFEAIDPAEQHLEGVRRILEYLRAGDVYQVNLARRLAASTPDTLALFERLQAQSPAPHALWLPGDAGCVVGNSPERFLRVLPGGAIETRPIKGTRPRTRAADDPAAAALARDPKDRAEHLMIVDLERNDLGRVCRTGSVRVEGFARMVSLATVHHLVSTVRGELRPGVTLPELLRATFPGGSITGAPKIRAMEIIDELEPAARGPYTGATGWLGAAGDLDLAVAIRTALVREQRLTLWVGGGIVADSVPEDELLETEVKAAAFARLAHG